MAVEMASQFDVERFIGKGCYSLVFRAVKNDGPDSHTAYALKRFFLQNPSSVKCALRERTILGRMALESVQSQFLPIMYYAFLVRRNPVFILREGTGCDLFDLIRTNGHLTETQCRFYICEIISGLSHLHAMEIVHLDLKPENVLLTHTGHIFISDFDRSYDLTAAQGKPTYDDFTGTPLFMAPEIAQGEIISTKADIWSLAILTAELVSGPVRPISKNVEEDLRWAREARVTIKGLKNFSKALQGFFSACLQRKYQQRPDVCELKTLRFLKQVNWNVVHAGTLVPPTSHLLIDHKPASDSECTLEPTDPRLIEAAFGKHMPITRSKQLIKYNKESCKNGGTASEVAFSFRKLPTIGSDTQALLNEGMTQEAIDELFEGFTYINSRCLPVDPVSLATEDFKKLNISETNSDVAAELVSKAAKVTSSHVHRSGKKRRIRRSSAAD